MSSKMKRSLLIDNLVYIFMGRDFIILWSLMVPYLTWADSNVAELGLLCGALAGLSSILGQLAGAGAVTITSATCG